MPTIRFRPRAWEDVQESATYLASEASPETGERFLDAVQAECATLASFPKIGSPCFFRNLRLRSLRRHPVSNFENWLIFYQPEEGAIEVVRVLHGARDISRILSEDDFEL